MPEARPTSGGRKSNCRRWCDKVAKLGALLFALGVLLRPSPARAGDPYLRWYTIETAHFRIHFHGGLEPAARRTAALAERIYERLVPHLGWTPREPTHILLTDDTDSANGSAGSQPYNMVRMFANAPDDMSPLSDYEDWQLELLTHEYTHILHVDNLSGIPALLNVVFGKSYTPNQVQPRWILEGLAVAMESEHTAGGRLRSTQFEMYLRADILEDNLASLDEISHGARRWPTGNLWYLYGAKFIEWISDVYGSDTFAAVATDYGSNVIPWGINRSIRRATGRTYTELWNGWTHHLRERYRKELAAVRRRGLREGVRLTNHGRIVASPRFVPSCAQRGAREELLYHRDDGHEPVGVYQVPLGRRRQRVDQDDSELIARSSGHTAAFDADCGIIFDSSLPSRRHYYLGDLVRQPPGTRSPRGLEHSRQRLTVGRRARDLDVSRDGRRLVYVTTHAGTSTLRIADLSAEHAVKNERRLVPSARYEQAYTPRFSPDGRKVAYSAWSSGRRDIRVVDLASGQFSEITHDRALDQHPVFSHDQRYLFFTSDRTGIANVYAYEFSSRRLFQVTNVRTGAYMPEPSPDARTLVYVGYTSEGFDLFSLPLERKRWLKAIEYLDDRPQPHAEPGPVALNVVDYDPLPTLRPRAWEFDYFGGAGRFGGDALVITTSGGDVAGLHGIAASVSLDFDQPGEPSLTADYVYRRLPFDLRLSAFRDAVPGGGFRINETDRPFIERRTGLSSGVSYGIPGEFDFQTVALTYSAAQFHGELPIVNPDPFATVTREPHQGFIGSVHLGWSYSNADSTHWSISQERGFSLSAGLDYADQITASDSTLLSLVGTATAYIPVPGLRHHVLALAGQGGIVSGNYPRRGFFTLGGYTDQTVGELLDAFTSGIRQTAFVLRGYEPGQFAGSQFNLLKAEYRFPILYVDRGVSTLPVFFRGVSGTLFADYGAAYDRIDLDDPFDLYHFGTGGELWLDLVLGYFARATIRFGVAKGIDDEAPPLQTYFVASSAF